MAKRTKKETALTPEEKLQQALVPVEEQPYPVPGNWCWTRLDFLKDGNEGFFDGDWILSENMDATGTVRLLQLSDIGIGVFLDKSNKHISKSTFEELNCTPLRAGDIIISRMAEPIARSCIVPDFPYTVITAVDVAVLRCNLRFVKNTYVNYLCNAKWFTDLAYSMARGTTRVRITRKNLGEMPIPLPPLPEQQRIVARIESLFAKLDEVKEKAQAVVDGYEDRKAAILHKAFTGELTAKWRKENGISLLSWKKATIGDVMTSVKDKYDPVTDSVLNISYIGLEHIEKGKGIINVGKSEDIKSMKTLFRTGDILYGKLRPYLDKHDIAPFDGMCSTDILVYRAKDDNSARFINYMMGRSAFIDYANRRSKGINLPRTSEKDISAYSFQLPTPNEQRQIVLLIDKLINAENETKSAAESVLNQIDTMKKSILARAFRGELGTNDPSDEPAIKLLKRVLKEE